MREFLAAVLTVIAMGVMLIAYSLSGSRATGTPSGLVQYADPYQVARPAAAERVELASDPSAPYAARTAMAYPASVSRSTMAYEPYAQPAPARVVPSSRAHSTAQVERQNGRNWQRTAMVVGG